ncbi:putative protein CC2D2B [Paratrimastix pyriformis]|uniref:C2 domain-containing protein n=1 Tax=Paratrimastix pyriformis TaxID=342808 RepID=A0ABQ8UTE7_9EUKA|nr:putative protein CC2D2B [Paratrimastix pyriformis]
MQQQATPQEPCATPQRTTTGPPVLTTVKRNRRARAHPLPPSLITNPPTTSDVISDAAGQPTDTAVQPQPEPQNAPLPSDAPQPAPQSLPHPQPPEVVQEADDQMRLLPTAGALEDHPYVRARLDRLDMTTMKPGTLVAVQPQSAAEVLLKRRGTLHSLADDGLYVGTPPHTVLANQYRMEQRLLLDPARGEAHFGPDGGMLAYVGADRTPRPLNELAEAGTLAPSLVRELDEMAIATDPLATFRGRLAGRLPVTRHGIFFASITNIPIPPTPSSARPTLNAALDPNQQAPLPGGDGLGPWMYGLELRVGSLRFSEHPLATYEHLLVSRVEALHAQIHRDRALDLVGYYNAKRLTLHGALADLDRRLSDLPAAPGALPGGGSGGSGVQAELVRTRADLRAEVAQVRKLRVRRDVLLFPPDPRVALTATPYVAHPVRSSPSVRLPMWLSPHVSLTPHVALTPCGSFIPAPPWPSSPATRPLITLRCGGPPQDDQQRAEQRRVEALLTLWAHIKRLRDGQGFHATGATLQLAITHPLRRRDGILHLLYFLCVCVSLRVCECQDTEAEVEQWARDIELAVVEESWLHGPDDPWDPEAAKLAILDRYIKEDRRRPPGARIVTPILTFTPDLPGLPPTMRDEQRRRQRVEGTRYAVRLVVNGRRVTQSRPVALDSAGMRCAFEEPLSLRVVRWPQSVCLQVLHVGAIDTVVATTYVKLPGTDGGGTGAMAEEQELSFAFEEPYTPLWVAPGLMPLVLEADQRHPLRYPAGILKVRVGWGRPHPPSTLIPIGTRTGTLAAPGCPAPTSGALWRHVPSAALGNLDIERAASCWESGCHPFLTASFVTMSPTTRTLPDPPPPPATPGATPPAAPPPARWVPVHEALSGLRCQSHPQPGLPLAEPQAQAQAAQSRALQDWMRAARLDPNDPRLRKVLHGAAPGEPGPGGFAFRYTSADSELFFPRGTARARELQRQRTLTYHDIIREDSLPPLRVSLDALAFLFQPPTRILPRRKRVVAELSAGADSIALLVQVNRASGIPIRRHEAYKRARTAPALAAVPVLQQDNDWQKTVHDDVPVNVYVEATFMGSRRATSCVSGTEPQWNETLELAFQPPPLELHPQDALGRMAAAPGLHEEHISSLALGEEALPPGGPAGGRLRGRRYTSLDFAEMREAVRLDLYDMVLFQNAKDDRNPDTLSLRRERHWLGAVTIPFSMVYTNGGSMEGTFPVCTPPVNLAYFPPPASAGGASGAPGDNPQGGRTTLSVFLSTDPPLPAAPQDTSGDIRFCKERRELTARAQRWLGGIRAMAQCKKRPLTVSVPPAPPRLVLPAAVLPADVPPFTSLATHSYLSLLLHAPTSPPRFVANVEGNGVFVCRYVRPQAPPPECPTMEACAHYVSLVPFLEDTCTFEGRSSLWTASHEFLDMLAGDHEEHALLLCNYFLALKQRAYVMLGWVVPDGVVTWTVTFPAPEDPAGSVPIFWDASAGRCYRATDPNCPVKRVGMLFDATNIWANVQPDESPARLAYDLENPRLWRPFFDASFPRPPDLESVQVAALAYQPTPPKYVADIEEAAVHEIKRALAAWRGHLRTSYNVACSNTLASLLPRLEEQRASQAMAGAGTEDPEQWKRLERVLATNLVHGFPLHMPFTDIDAVVVRSPLPCPACHAPPVMPRMPYPTCHASPVPTIPRLPCLACHIPPAPPAIPPSAWAVEPRRAFHLVLTLRSGLQDAVRRTNLHECTADDVQFGLAVHAHPYPNKVVSLWVYLAALLPLPPR